MQEEKLRAQERAARPLSPTAAIPTPCPRCGMPQPSGHQATTHCIKRRGSHASKGEGWIYFAMNENATAIKIGFTINPTVRLFQLNHTETSIPEGIDRKFNFIGLMRGTYADEQAIHQRFKSERLILGVGKHREWYPPDGQAAAWIDTQRLQTIGEVRANFRRANGLHPKAKAKWKTLIRRSRDNT